MGIARARQMAGRREYPNDIRDNEQRKAGNLAMGITRARQMAGRRRYPNDIRDNEQRKVRISRIGNRKDLTNNRIGEKTRRR